MHMICSGCCTIRLNPGKVLILFSLEEHILVLQIQVQSSLLIYQSAKEVEILPAGTARRQGFRWFPLPRIYRGLLRKRAYLALSLV